MALYKHQYEQTNTIDFNLLKLNMGNFTVMVFTMAIIFYH